MTRPPLRAILGRRATTPRSAPSETTTPLAARVIDAVRSHNAADRIVLMEEETLYFPEPGSPSTRRPTREVQVIWERESGDRIAAREDRMLNLRDALRSVSVHVSADGDRARIHERRETLDDGSDWTVRREDLSVDTAGAGEVNVWVQSLVGSGGVTATAPEGWTTLRPGSTVDVAQVGVRVPVDKRRAVYIQTGPPPRTLATHIASLAVERSRQTDGADIVGLARQLEEVSRQYVFTGRTAQLLNGSVRRASGTMEITVAEETATTVTAALLAQGAAFANESSAPCSCDEGRPEQCPQHMTVLLTTAGRVHVNVVDRDHFSMLSIGCDRREMDGATLPVAETERRSTVRRAPPSLDTGLGIQRILRPDK